MIVTIKVLTCVDGDPSRSNSNSQIVARGYLPSGQEFLTSRVFPSSERKTAIRSIVEWLFRHRPGWNIEIDDQRYGHTEVTP